MNIFDGNSLRRVFVPERARVLKRWFLRSLIARQRASLPAALAREYQSNPDFAEIVDYLRVNRAEMIPYFFTDHYRNLPITIEKDRAANLKFVMVSGSEIYYPASFSDELIAESIRVAMMEQDPRSPHRYLPAQGIDISGDVAVICGASDCIYTLEILRKFRHVYIIEADPLWLEPMKQTLRDFSDKITIVQKFVSDQDGPTSITLDALLRDQNVNYIQADIEGAESKLLRGAKTVLGRNDQLKLSICCYHTVMQERELTVILESLNYTVRQSDGVVLMWMQYPLRRPYFRKAVLYAQKRASPL